MKKTIRLTESDLRKVIKESVKRILRENNYDFELQSYRERRNGENTYLQVAMLGSPESHNRYGSGEAVTNDYINMYNTLCNEPPENVLSLWRQMAYESNVTTNYESNDKFIVEEDNDGVYLLIRVDNEADIPKYQQGNW